MFKRVLILLKKQTYNYKKNAPNINIEKPFLLSKIFIRKNKKHGKLLKKDIEDGKN